MLHFHGQTGDRVGGRGVDYLVYRTLSYTYGLSLEGLVLQWSGDPILTLLPC